MPALNIAYLNVRFPDRTNTAFMTSKNVEPASAKDMMVSGSTIPINTTIVQKIADKLFWIITFTEFLEVGPL